MAQAHVAHILLRIGAAFAFIYPPVAALFDPVTFALVFWPENELLPPSV